MKYYKNWWSHPCLWSNIDYDPLRPTENAAFRSIQHQAWELEIERMWRRLNRKKYD